MLSLDRKRLYVLYVREYFIQFVVLTHLGTEPSPRTSTSGPKPVGFLWMRKSQGSIWSEGRKIDPSANEAYCTTLLRLRIFTSAEYQGHLKRELADVPCYNRCKDNLTRKLTRAVDIRRIDNSNSRVRTTPYDRMVIWLPSQNPTRRLRRAPRPCHSHVLVHDWGRSRVGIYDCGRNQVGKE
jgi:hypothetical protein